jgi:hypothetical protein
MCLQKKEDSNGAKVPSETIDEELFQFVANRVQPTEK